LASSAWKFEKNSFVLNKKMEDQYTAGFYIGMAIFAVIAISVAILFLLNQHNTLKAIQPENRLISPGQVWLQLIPIFNLVWRFIVVTRVSDSIKREFESWQNDSILGLPDAQAAQLLNERPTYNIGIAYCVLACCTMIPILGAFAAIAYLVCWIIYWVRLAEYRRMIERKSTF
jgi:hypothetical protein